MKLKATLLILLSVSVIASAQHGTRELYRKYEVMIPTRDGTRLFTAIYQPRDSTTDYPILIERTPYGVYPYGPDDYRYMAGPTGAFYGQQYIYVYQDVRGRMMSEGMFADVRPLLDSASAATGIDEASDVYDTIDWLVKNLKHNNGKVGIRGVSYPGFYAAQAMVRPHPALKAVSPQAPVSDWFAGDDFHHNGALFVDDAFSFLSGFGKPRPVPTSEGASGFPFTTNDAYDFYLRLGAVRHANEWFFKDSIAFWNDIMRHGRYDAFWKDRNPLKYYTNVRPAVMVVGGWFDAEDLWGTLATYKKVAASNPAVTPTLVMGPWSHGEWNGPDTNRIGQYDYVNGTQTDYRSTWELPFFDYYLKGKGNGVPPGARVFDTGKREWRSFASWPPAGMEELSIYLDANGTLADVPPRSRDGADECLSDPSKPVPYTATVTIGRTREYMVEDQRFAATRPDVLVYQSEPLGRDMTVAGSVLADLFVSTTGTDADYVVKVIDVYPDSSSALNVCNIPVGGMQQMVRAEIMRGKFRHSLEFPEPFRPGIVEEVKFTLPDLFHTFRAGHRLMVQIQFSWFPLVDRNPQKFLDINNARDEDFVKAMETVYRSSGAPSRIVMPVLR